MISKVQMGKLTLLVGMIIGLQGCSPRKLDSLIMDEQVSYDKFHLGYILFADAVMDASSLKLRRESTVSDSTQLIAKDDLTDIESRRSAEILVATMKDDRETIKSELAVTHPRMTPEMAKSLLDVMKAGREFPSEMMAKFSEIFLKHPRPYRYLAQLRVEGERISKRHREYTETKEEPTKRLDAQGKAIAIKIPYQVNEYISGREMDLRLLIFDMKQKKVVFDGVAVERSAVSNKKERRMGTIVIGGSSDSSGSSYPEFPDRLSLIQSGAKRFVGAIPKG